MTLPRSIFALPKVKVRPRALPCTYNSLEGRTVTGTDRGRGRGQRYTSTSTFASKPSGTGIGDPTESESALASTSSSTKSKAKGNENGNENGKPLIVLGIETSADDSSCSIVASSSPSSSSASGRSRPQILALSTISQYSQNALYGGIHPLHAQRAHSANLPLAIRQAFVQARAGAGQGKEETFGVGPVGPVGPEDLDAIAYTRGPGMRGCLAVGEMAAKGLAAALNVPLVGVHHMQAHALTPLLTEPDPPSYPFLILLVSGGHTQLVLARSQERFQILLDTLDSKIGDIFEKAARHLLLPSNPSCSPGATLEQYASLPPMAPYDHRPLPALSVPLSTGESRSVRAFSFSGILSALQRAAEPLFQHQQRHHAEQGSRSGTDQRDNVGVSVNDKQTKQDTRGHQTTSPTSTPLSLEENHQRELSRIFQTAVLDHLTLKLSQAISALVQDPTVEARLGGLVVSGGVAANLALRQRLEEMVGSLELGQSGSGSASVRKGEEEEGQDGNGDGKGKKMLFYPPIELCTDNAAMIAWAAILRLRPQAGSRAFKDEEEKEKGDPYDLPLRPKWSLEDLYDDIPQS